ncbi:MAG: Gfo/Idh/MocA family protein [Terriglobales bacterium]
MQGLVVGGGSIGKRHLQNLKLLGIDSLALVETDPERRAAVASELKIRSFADLTAGLNWPPDFVVVATPTHLHAEQTLTIVEKGLPVFVEKPLSHNAARLQQISDLVERSRLISLVGCNMRFHPGPAQVKDLLEQNRIGHILFARLQAGSYLPSWRPSQDYRANYAAREETGGGCILDCIHEIDLANWYLGEVQNVFCVCGKLSSLEIATEDVAALVCRHESGALSEIHLDYVQRTYERDCQIVGEQGSIFWEFKNRQVSWFDAAGGQWTTFSQPPGWELNQMYVDEMKHFLECIRDKRQTVLPIPDAISVMQIAFAAKASAREGRLVTIKKEVPA